MLVLRSRGIPRGCRKPRSQSVWSRGGDSASSKCSQKQAVRYTARCSGRTQTADCLVPTEKGHSHCISQWFLRFPESSVCRPLSVAQSLGCQSGNHPSTDTLQIIALQANGSILHKDLVKWNGDGWLPQGYSVPFVKYELSDFN